MKYALVSILLLTTLSVSHAATVRVPLDANDIQSGLDTAIAGDTVLVAPGIYTGSGNWDISFGGKAVVLRSQDGPRSTVIECYDAGVPHQGVLFVTNEGAGSRIEGLTIRNAASTGSSIEASGGAINCYRSSPRISDCILQNSSGIRGGGIYMVDASPAVVDCRLENCSGSGMYAMNSSPSVMRCHFYSNSGSMGGGTHLDFGCSIVFSSCVFAGNSGSGGGGIYCQNMTPGAPPVVQINNCTFYGNSGYGTAVLVDGYAAMLNLCIIAFGTGGVAVHCTPAAPANLNCCDVYGNSGGDFVGCIAGQEPANISADPLFCNPGLRDFHISSSSPCSPGNNYCGLIGALGAGCQNRIWTVSPDGSGDSPNIQAAIDQATTGDTILLDQGIFQGAGNRDIVFEGKELVIKSLFGPDLTSIDCQGSESDNHTAITIQSGVSSLSLIEGITIINAYVTLPEEGGALECNSASPTIRRCVFMDNTSIGGSNGGSAVRLLNSSSLLEACVFYGNRTPQGLGGAFFASGSTFQLDECTFVDNMAWYGDAIGLTGSSNLSASQCIIAFNGNVGWGTFQGSVVSFSGGASFGCSDIFGNVGGDWVGGAAGQGSVDGNISSDPIFCDLPEGDLYLSDYSPCTSLHNDCGLQMGALPVSCQTPVPGLLAPDDGGVLVTEDDVSFQWDRVSWADEYTVEISTSDIVSDIPIEDRPTGSFGTVVTYVPLGDTDTWTLAAGGLQEGNYFWHVMASNEYVEGIFSEIRAFSIEPPPDYSEWPLFLHDENRTARTDIEILPPYRKSWDETFFATGGEVRAPVCVAGDTVYVANCKGQIYALDIHSKYVYWNRYLGGQYQVWAAPQYSDGKIYIAASTESSSGLVYCLNSSDGTDVWGPVSFSNGIMTAPTIVGNKLLIYSGESTSVLDGNTGAGVNSYSPGGLWAPAAVWNGKAYFNSYNLVEYDPASNSFNQIFSTDRNSPVAISPDGHLYYCQTARLASFNLNTLQPDWTSGTYFIGEQLPRYLAVGDEVVLVVYGNTVQAVRRSDGSSAWSTSGSQGGSLATNSAIIAGSTVLLSSQPGFIYCFSLETGAEIGYYYLANYVYGPPVAAKGKILIGSDDGNLYALENGQETMTVLTVWAFNDANGDGLHGGFESDLANLTVSISDGQSGTTRANGRCSFNVVGTQTYTVSVQTPANMSPTTPNPITVTAYLQSNNIVFFGFQKTPVVSISPPTFGPLTEENPDITFDISLLGDEIPLADQTIEVWSYIAPSGTPGWQAHLTTDANGYCSHTWSTAGIDETPGYDVNFIARFTGNNEWGPDADTSFGSISPRLLVLTLDDPAEGSTISLPYTFRWHTNKETGEIDHRIQFSNDCTFENPVYEAVFASTYANIELTVVGGTLITNQTYYWRVLVEREGYATAVSDTLHFVLEEEAPPTDDGTNNLACFNDVIFDPGTSQLVMDTIRRLDGTLYSDYPYEVTLKIIEGVNYGHIDNSDDEDPSTTGVQITPVNGILQVALTADQVGSYVLIEASGEYLEPDTIMIYIGGYPDMRCSIRSNTETLWPGDEVNIFIDYGNVGLCAARNVIMIASLNNPNVEYMYGSATVSGTSSHIEYSTDFGANWLLSEPSTHVTDIKWVIPKYTVTGSPNSSGVQYKLKVIDNPDLGSTINNCCSIAADYIGTMRDFLEMKVIPEDEFMAVKFAPVYVFHPEEEYRPIAVETFLDNGSTSLATWTNENDWLWLNQESSLIDASSYTIGEYNSVEPGTMYYLRVGNDRYYNRDDFLPLMSDDETPVYCRIVTSEYGGTQRKVIQYWSFYAYNDFFNRHQGDWELVEIVFQNDSYDYPQYVTMSVHEGAIRRSWDQLISDDPIELWPGTCHPVVYVAKGSHAGYPIGGLHGEWPHELLEFISCLKEAAGYVSSSLLMAEVFSYWVQREGILFAIGATGLEGATDFVQGLLVAIPVTSVINYFVSVLDNSIDRCGIDYSFHLLPERSGITTDYFYSVHMIDKPGVREPWLDYVGKWGRRDPSQDQWTLTAEMSQPLVFDARQYGSGPFGPNMQSEKWNEPARWGIEGRLDWLIAIRGASPFVMRLFDENGNSSGASPSGDIFELPNSYARVEGSEPMIILLENPTGDFNLQLIGEESGTYHLDITLIDPVGDTAFNQYFEGDIQPQQILELPFECSVTGEVHTISIPSPPTAPTDNTPPDISILGFPDFSVCDSGFEFKFAIYDGDGIVDRYSVAAYVDLDSVDTGRLDPSGQILTVILPCSISNNQHQIVVRASDISGNSSEFELSFFPGNYGSLSGFVNSQSGCGLQGVTLDIYDSMDSYWQSCTSNDSGYYHIDSIPNGDYSISVIIPEGYSAYQETKQFMVAHVPVEVDFELFISPQCNLLPTSWSSSWTTDPRGTIRAYIGNIAGDNSAEDIDPTTIMLNHEVPIYGGRYRIRPSMTGFDGSVLEISFSRQLAVQSLGEDAEAGTHTVTITGEFNDGNKFVSEVEITLDGTPPAKIEAETDQPTVPTEFSLGNAYPNPFNPTTTIEFGVPSDGNVRIEVFNINGQKVKTLTNQYYTAGSYTVEWNSTDESGNEVATGVYLYRMTASDFTETKKMVLMK